jgi:hypothetical protein
MYDRRHRSALSLYRLVLRQHAGVGTLLGIDWTKNQQELDRNSSQPQGLAAPLVGMVCASTAIVTVGVSRR